jgi:hypothetical protein
MQIATPSPPSIQLLRVRGADGALVKLRWQQVEMRTRRARCASPSTSTTFSTLASAVGVNRWPHTSRAPKHVWNASPKVAGWQGDVFSDSHRSRHHVRVREIVDYPCMHSAGMDRAISMVRFQSACSGIVIGPGNPVAASRPELSTTMCTRFGLIRYLSREYIACTRGKSNCAAAHENASIASNKARANHHVAGASVPQLEISDPSRSQLLREVFWETQPFPYHAAWDLEITLWPTRSESPQHCDYSTWLPRQRVGKVIEESCTRRSITFPLVPQAISKHRMLTYFVTQRFCAQGVRSGA